MYIYIAIYNHVYIFYAERYSRKSSPDSSLFVLFSVRLTYPSNGSGCLVIT